VTADVKKEKESEYEYDGIFDVLGKCWKNDGVFGWYSGFFVGCGGIFLYRWTYFLLWEVLGEILRRNDGLELRVLFTWGSGVMTGLVTYPVDTVRKRMVVRSGKGRNARAVDVVKEIWKEEGVLGFWRGAMWEVGRRFVFDRFWWFFFIFFFFFSFVATVVLLSCMIAL